MHVKPKLSHLGAAHKPNVPNLTNLTNVVTEEDFDIVAISNHMLLFFFLSNVAVSCIFQKLSRFKDLEQ